MKSLYLLLLTLVISAVSCRTKDGAPGPAGDNTLTQQGHVSGNVTFVNQSGATVTAPFKYEYYESLSQNRFYIFDDGADSDYEITLSRRAANDNSNYFDFGLVGYNNMLDGTEENPFYTPGYLNFVLVSNNILYQFEGYDIDITNVHLDITTGRLTFDYTGNLSHSNGNGTATVTGTVDVTLYRVYHSIISWG